MDDEKKIDKDEIFEDDSILEEFMESVDENGLSMATMNDGHVLGMTLEKLKHFVEIAEQNTEKRLIIFIRNSDESDLDDLASTQPSKTEWKN